MYRDQVLEEAKNLGAKIGRETLRRWVNAGLIPTPERGNLGRAGGKWSKYPRHTPWEVFATFHMLKRYSMEQTAQTRKAALGFIADFCYSKMPKYESDMKEAWEADRFEAPGQSITYGDYTKGTLALHEMDPAVLKWMMFRFKAEFASIHSISTEDVLKQRSFIIYCDEIYDATELPDSPQVLIDGPYKMGFEKKIENRDGVHFVSYLIESLDKPPLAVNAEGEIIVEDRYLKYKVLLTTFEIARTLR